MEIYYFAVDTDMDIPGWISAIRDQLNKIKINFSLSQVDDKTLEISVPNESMSCSLLVDKMNPSFPRSVSGYEMLSSSVESLQKKYLLTLTGDREDRAVNFIFNIITKTLGPITKGTLIDVEQAYVTDDWITWGYDYIDIENFDMFEIFQSAGLDQQYPALRIDP